MRRQTKTWMNVCFSLSIVVNAMIVILIVSSCGGRNGGDEYGNQTPAPAESKAWDDIKPVVAASCGKCHNGTNQAKFDSQDRLVNSKALVRLENGSMPPGGKIDAGAKSKLIAFIKAAK